MSKFQKQDIVPADLFRQITDIRVENPQILTGIAQKRKRRDTFAPSGKINIVAADHPARGSLSVGEEPFAMADRHDLLARLTYLLQSQWVDGVLGSMDLLEELLILHELMKKNGTGFLDKKLLIASLNRGGHPGAVWELHDPVTGADADTCKTMNLDAAKMLLRMDDRSEDSLKTLMVCADALREMSGAGMPVFLEPLPVQPENNSYTVLKEPNRLLKLVSIAAALGNTSRNTWLKLPYGDQFEKVVKATTLPVVILGGDRSSDLTGLLTGLHQALSSGHQVRGAIYGRNVLYPAEADPLRLAETIGKMIHQKIDLEAAVKALRL